MAKPALRENLSEVTMGGEIFPVGPDIEKVVNLLVENDKLIEESRVVLDGDQLKMLMPTGVTEGNPDEMYLVVMAIPDSSIKNARGLDSIITEGLTSAGYDEEIAEVLKDDCLNSYTKYYEENKRNNTRSKSGALSGKVTPALFSAANSVVKAGDRMTSPTEWVGVSALRFREAIFSERAKETAIAISDEHFEAMMLEAMARNDETRFDHLAHQAALQMVTATGMGMDTSWVDLYENTMLEKMGEGKYPALNTLMGRELFIKEIYIPLVASSLAAAEVASVMGDKLAADETTKLKEAMAIALYDSKARVAESTQPARAKVESARLKADAQIAVVLRNNEEVLTAAKRINASLLAKSVAHPVFTFFGQMGASAVEILPSSVKGFAMALDRWMSQEGVDKRLVGITSGGLAVGLTGGCVLAFVYGSVWLVPAGAVIAPIVFASGYMWVKGFKEAGEDKE